MKTRIEINKIKEKIRILKESIEYYKFSRDISIS